MNEYKMSQYLYVSSNLALVSDLRVSLYEPAELYKPTGDSLLPVAPRPALATRRSACQ